MSRVRVIVASTVLGVPLAAAAVGAVAGSASAAPTAPARASADEQSIGHFAGRPGERRVVDVVDHTGPAWPVRAAAQAWNRSSSVTYRYAAGCADATRCVQVWEGRYGQTGWKGLTTTYTDRSGTFAAPTVVKLNDSYPSTPPDRRATVCQELGHALGLGHSASATSCMNETAPATTPDAGDFARLDAIYRR